VISWFRSDDSSPRPPLPGRLIGLAVGVALLSLSALFVLHVVGLLIPVVVPLFGVLLVYARTKTSRKQAANARRAWEKRLLRIQAEVHAEQAVGRLQATDTLSVIRAAEQWHRRQRARQEQRAAARRLARDRTAT
jgi:hypothetical protein